MPFTPISADTDGLARRIEVHEFPFRDQPFAEDFGQQTRSFAFECFVPWQRPANAEKGGRDDLQKACAEPGSGRLVHPFWGERDVVCTSARARESNAHIGLTIFSLEFTDAGSNAFPDAVPNTEAQVADAASAARTDVQESFVSHWSGLAPQWVTDASIARVQDLATALEVARALVPGGVNLASFNEVLRELADPATLVSDPPLLASKISDAVRGLAGLSTDPLSTIRMLASFVADFGATFATIDANEGTSRFTEGERQSSLVRLAHGSAVVEASVAATSVPLASYDEAAALRDFMVELFGPEIDAAGDAEDDAALLALLSVRTEVLSDLRARGAQLATVRAVTLGATTPGVVLAYRLYADPDRAEEIVARNALRHPMFLPAGVPLEVLSA